MIDTNTASEPAPNALILTAMKGTVSDTISRLSEVLRTHIVDHVSVLDVKIYANYSKALQYGSAEGATPFVVFLYTRCIAHMQQAMAGGMAPDAALDEWCTHAQELIALLRVRRRDVLLVDCEAAELAPQAFLDACSTRFNQPLTNGAAELEPPAVSGDNVYRIIAALALTHSRHAMQLEAELEASAIPLVSVEKLPSVSLLEAFRDYFEIKSKENENKILTREQCDRKLNDQRHKNDLLIGQLKQVREELESYNRELIKERQKKAEINNRLGDAECRIEVILASTSWKLTSPLRRLKMLIKPQT